MDTFSVSTSTFLTMTGLGWLSLFSALALFALIRYRLFIHPLAKVPGPFLQRVSGFSRIWQCKVGDRFLREKQAHDRYGTAVRIAPNAVTFSTLSALDTIHAKDANVFKGDEFYGLLDGGSAGGRSVQMTADNAAHAARRRVLDKGLPPRQQAFDDINELSQHFVEALVVHTGCDRSEKRAWMPAVDITSVATWYTFDVIGLVAFGESLDMLHSPQYRFVAGTLMRASVFLFWGGYAPFLGFWRWILDTSLPSVLRLNTIVESQNYTEFSDFMLKRRSERMTLEKGGDPARTDIFRHLLASGLYSDLDLRADSSLLIAAGSDANRLIIAATVFYWLRNPEIYDKVVQEIRFAVDSEAQITDAALSSMKYLRACVDETLRVAPPKASSLPREVKEGGITIDGIYVPAGMTVGISIYALHHDPDIYPDPYTYNPDRWLQQPQDRRMQAALCPFLKGPRMCPGKTVAYFAIELALFHLLYRYDIRAPDGVVTGGGRLDLSRLRRHEEEYQFHDWILGYGEGPLIELSERSEAL